MLKRWPFPGVFITATDTEVGKTQVAAAILIKLAELGVTAVGMKPVASGARMTSHGLRSEDAEILIGASGVAVSYEAVNPYVFELAIAPHLAARQTSSQINLQHIAVNYDSLVRLADFVVVEGVGGWQAPLNDNDTVADLALLLNLPVVLVVAIRLGCINHALLSVESIIQGGSNLVGWIANHTSAKNSVSKQITNSLESRLGVPMIANIPHIETCSPKKLASALDLDQAQMNWISTFTK